MTYKRQLITYVCFELRKTTTKYKQTNKTGSVLLLYLFDNGPINISAKMMQGKGNRDIVILLNKCRTCLDTTDHLQSLTKMAIVEESKEISYGELLTEIVQINVTCILYK